MSVDTVEENILEANATDAARNVFLKKEVHQMSLNRKGLLVVAQRGKSC